MLIGAGIYVVFILLLLLTAVLLLAQNTSVYREVKCMAVLIYRGVQLAHATQRLFLYKRDK